MWEGYQVASGDGTDLPDILTEGAWTRARNDTRQAFKGFWFKVAVGVSEAAATVLVAPFATDPEQSIERIALVSVGALVAASLLPVVVVLCVAAVLAPYRQRNDARQQLTRYVGEPEFTIEPASTHDKVFVRVRNDGPTSTFRASVQAVAGVDASVAVPWGVQWRDVVGPDCTIVTGEEAVLRLATVDVAHWRFHTPAAINLDARHSIGREVNIFLRVSTLDPVRKKEWRLRCLTEAKGGWGGVTVAVLALNHDE